MKIVYKWKFIIIKKKHWNVICWKQNDECIPYEHFSLEMRKLNDEQIRIIVDDILHWKNKYPLKPLHLF
jgi:hypothetical protein